MANKKVLVVDDSATVRQQVALALSPAGFDVVEAVDGVQGLKLIETTEELRLVICDVNMPHKNGIEMLSEAKADGKNADLPIVMLTTEGQPALIKKAKEAGACGWIVKPFKADRLVAAAQKLTA
ncbi:MAG: response regulator [Myxococcales bacterium]|nr:response regulator [Myxococcales bacterium]MDD9966216.1 response regulator [Myxococcales bacterium]